MNTNIDYLENQKQTRLLAETRDLYSQVSALTDRVVELENKPADTTPNVVPPQVNFADNTDFIFSDESYNTASYTDDEDVLANWYARAQATATSWVENTTSTESTESIRSSAHGSGARATAEWDTGKGVIAMTGGYKIAGRLSSKIANSGNLVVVRVQITRATGTSLGSGVKAKVSIWDNTDNRILRGSVPVLTATKQGSHSGGTVTRQYILEVMMADGRSFYSDTSSFTTGQNQVVNSVARTTIDSDDYVNIVIPKIVGASRYNIYARTPSEADTNWYRVDSVPVSTTQVSDYGGGLTAWTVPSFDNDHKQYQLAEAFVDDLDLAITETNSPYESAFGIQIPTNFVVNGNQFIQIEFLKSDYSATTTTEIPADSIYIDKVGISYNNGRWTPSARDMTKVATPITPSDPIPSGGGTGGGEGGGGGGGGYEDPPGGGGYCVHRNTNILLWDEHCHYEIPASSVVVGDTLVAWDGEKFVPSKVKRVINGKSRFNYKIYALDKTLICSFGHRLIADFNDFERGTTVGKIGNTTLTYSNGTLVRTKLDGIECFDSPINVVTFKLEVGKENYVANGFMCHNLKPLE